MPPTLSQTVPAATTVSSASPNPAPSRRHPRPEGATDPATLFAAPGIGPYVVGARLAAFESEGLVADVWSMSAGQVERLDIAAVVGEGC